MKKIIQVALVSLFAMTMVSANNKQNHHCKMADGNMDMAKTKKECHKAKGKWVKDESGEKHSSEKHPAGK